MMTILISYFIVCCVIFHGTLSANILLINNVASHSQSMWHTKLATLLADNGHRVTFLDTDPMKNPLKNVTHYEMTGGYGWESDINELVRQQESLKMTLEVITEWSKVLCKNLLFSEGVKNFIENSQNEKFDLLIMDFMCEAYAAFSYKFGNIPIILATAFEDPSKVLNYIGNYDNPSYVPHQFSSYNPSMCFKERIINTLVTVYTSYLEEQFKDIQNENARELLGKDVPNIQDIFIKNIRLAFINTHFSMRGVKPLLPNVVTVSGFHIDKPKPLEKDIKNFLDNSQQPIIYFSLGSNIKSKSIGDEKLKIFIEAFREIPYEILWKLESSRSDLPSNVKIAKWFKQSDVLAHPNVKLFISHCGELGTQEAIYHGKPVLGMPFFIDQLFNSENLIRKNVSLYLSYKDLTKSDVIWAIKEMIENPSYTENMKKLSSVFKDNINEPSEKVLYWINYVLRHPDGKYLRSPTLHLRWYQIYLLDILTIFLFSLLISIIAIYSTIKFLCKIVCAKKVDKKKTN